MVPWKSSIGLISSKISARPDLTGMSVRPDAMASVTRARHKSLPSNESKLSTWSDKRFGTSSGSRIFAKLIRLGPGTCDDEVREAAKRDPSLGWRLWSRATFTTYVHWS